MSQTYTEGKEENIIVSLKKQKQKTKSIFRSGEKSVGQSLDVYCISVLIYFLQACMVS